MFMDRLEINKYIPKKLCQLYIICLYFKSLPHFPRLVFQMQLSTEHPDDDVDVVSVATFQVLHIVLD